MHKNPTQESQIMKHLQIQQKLAVSRKKVQLWFYKLPAAGFGVFSSKTKRQKNCGTLISDQKSKF